MNPPPLGESQCHKNNNAGSQPHCWPLRLLRFYWLGLPPAAEPKSGYQTKQFTALSAFDLGRPEKPLLRKYEAH